jgi:3-hydroxy acid dehydrogenase / malonic semialdehyde reductase
MNKVVCITGATAGIGEACADIFAAAGFDLILTGRRRERLEALQQKLTETHNRNVSILVFDVQQRKEVFDAFENISSLYPCIDVLINNAGLALGRDAFDTADLNDWETMLHTNVDGLLYCSRAAMPLLKKSEAPHIINIGSIAGKEVYENGNVYCASKYAVDAITKSMRIDLLKYGIKVTGIHPGAVETEFSLVRFKGDEEKSKAAYKGFKPLTAVDIANTVFYTANLPAHVCINDLVITCTAQAGTYYFHKNQ